MKSITKRFGLIALIAVIGFSFGACKDGSDTGGRGTAPKITTASLQDGKVGTAYSQTLAATGDAPVTWSLDGGTTLPEGLSLATTGEISGTPIESRQSTFTVKATNKAGSDTKVLTLIITTEDGGVGPSITTETLVDGKVGVAYTATLAATGDDPITWSIEEGDLPDGLELDADDGTITGTPTTAETLTFTVKAENDSGEDTKEFTIAIESESGGFAPTITTTELPGGTVGEVYTATLAATGEGTITWSIDSGDWPDGLELDEDDGTITGTPTTADTFTFTVKAENDVGPSTKELSITIADDGGNGGTAPTITTTGLQDGTVGEEYTATLAATGDDTITWSIDSGDLPDGLELDEDEGTITGTPTTADTFTFTVKAENAVGSDTASLSITIEPADDDGDDGSPTITTTELPDGTVGSAYSRTLAATGDDITWTLNSGTLPTGLSLATTGSITGTPSAAGTFTFTVKAANEAGNVNKQLSIKTFSTDAMVLIEGGTFTMGCPTTEPTSAQYDSWERQHQVKLTKDFYMGKYLVTQERYNAVMGSNPSGFSSGGAFPDQVTGLNTTNFPVEGINWYDAIVFCNTLSMKEGKSPAYSMYKSTSQNAESRPDLYPDYWNNSENWSTDPKDWGTVPTARNARWSLVVIVANSAGYRLPTEAQWEYACRAGTETAYNTGDNTISDDTGWYIVNSGNRTHSVGEKSVNAWGLYDMHGNVEEFCQDWSGNSYADGEDPTGAAAPANPASQGTRVARGGSWLLADRYLRSASRDTPNPGTRSATYGIRLVLPAPTE